MWKVYSGREAELCEYAVSIFHGFALQTKREDNSILLKQFLSPKLCWGDVPFHFHHDPSLNHDKAWDLLSSKCFWLVGNVTVRSGQQADSKDIYIATGYRRLVSDYYRLCSQQGVRALQSHRQIQFHMNMQSVGTAKLPKAGVEQKWYSTCYAIVRIWAFPLKVHTSSFFIARRVLSCLQMERSKKISFLPQSCSNTAVI